MNYNTSRGTFMLYENLHITNNGELMIANTSTLDLAKQYGTPLYVMDKQQIIKNIKMYKEAITKFDNAQILYASKACDFLAMFQLCKQENIGVDVVSIGEFYTAIKANIPVEHIYYHGNSKTYQELEYAIQNKVGCIVIDAIEEIHMIQEIASQYNCVQKSLLRITPNIDPHTFEAVTTGILDCKFGFAIDTNTIDEAILTIKNCPNIHLAGIHCHIGSQITDANSYQKTMVIMLQLIQQMKERYQINIEELNIGGGFGICYTKTDTQLNIQTLFQQLAKQVEQYCQKHQLLLPKILIEPGRSIVADAGITLYRVNSVKQIPNVRTYINIDGGMTDNPRYALYKSNYTVVCANKMIQEPTVPYTIAGHCCESGDLIAKDVILPKIETNDILAVLATGAYNYSMSSNYNRFLKPAVILVDKNQHQVVVKRETLQDLLRNDLSIQKEV